MNIRPWFRALWAKRPCWGGCRCAPYEDAGGFGGQCVRCGRIVGYVTRADLRAHADRQLAKLDMAPLVPEPASRVLQRAREALEPRP